MEENKEKTVKKRLTKRGRKIMKVLRVRFKALQHMRDV